MRPALYVFINKGLQMSAGKVAAQAVQASVGGYLSSGDEIKKTWWELGGHHATYVMEARDEDHLLSIQRYLWERGFYSFLMIDEGMTEIDAITETALGVEIVDKDDPHVAATFSSFKLYKDTVRVTLEFDR